MMYKITKKLVFRKPIPDLKRFLLILSLGLFLGAFQNAFAQRTVSGKVTDDTGSGIPGVAVVVKGTDVGSVTDVDGNYSISVPGDNAVLIFSSVGFANREETVGSRSTIDVAMESTDTQLSELVVTGYTIDDRRETSGSVAIVKAKDLQVIPSGNVEQQLQGRVAGITVISNGQPGTTSQIRVRGFGAFGGNEPLYVVDGVPVGSTDFLNPDDIETTTVLKDAAAASIYGARAANGVIIYTTKRGTRGAKKLNVTYDGLVGFTDPGKGIEMLNPTDFADWTWRALANSGLPFSHPQFGTGTTPVIPTYLSAPDFDNPGQTRSGVSGEIDLETARPFYNIDPTRGSIVQLTRANVAGTDWYDAISRTGSIHRHTIGINGGGESSRYYVGMSLQDQDGILRYQNFQRYTFRVNTEFDVLKNLRIGENIQITYRQVLGLLGGEGGIGAADDENLVLDAVRMPTIIPVFDEFGGYAGTASRGFNNPRNPVASQDGSKDNRNFNINGFGNVYLEYEPIKGLVLRTSLGGQYNYNYNWFYSRRQYENSENNSAFTYGEGGSYTFQWVYTNTANFKRTFGQHGVDVLAGIEALNTGSGRGINGSGLNPFSLDPDYITLPNTERLPVNSFQFKGVNFYSLFSRLNYTFNDRYIFSFVIRRDGSSRFGSNNRYGVFPAFSLAWRLSSESFMQGLTWINDLKIRGGYGAMGNSNNVNPNNQYSLYGGDLGNSSYDINGTNSSALLGFYRTRIGNPDAKWETSITANVGFDGTFFNNKLDIIFDWWQKDTRDLLFQVPVPSVLGYQASAPSVNIAEMKNAGVDIQIITRGKISEVSYEVTVNGGFLKNEIVSLAGDLTYITAIDPGYRGINPIRNQLGRPLSSFFGYQVEGLFRDQADVDAHATQNGAAPGRFKFADTDGDGEITPDDRVWLGAPVPKFQGGLNFKITWKGIDLEVYSFLSAGNKVWNQTKWFTHLQPSFLGSQKAEAVKDSWTPQNLDATIPIFETASNFSTNTQANSWYVEDGSYFRMQNITLGYNFPTAILQKLKMTRLRVYASTNNVFTISGYSGLDPSVGGGADTTFGIDVGNYPITRSFTFGVNLGF
ncbi:MAG: TonB-dependent receptor [Microscillaceae bacterium]|nr:TonB-dependent receptor [Microscillaceae bacterium]